MDWIEGHIQTLQYLQPTLSAKIARKLFLQPIAITIDRALIKNRTYSLIFCALVNQLSRIFPLVEFSDLPESPLSLTPWGKSEPLRRGASPKITIHLGMECFGKKGVISVNAKQWHIYIDTPCDIDVHEAFNPVLAILAAAYASSRCTKLLLRKAIEGAKTWRPFSILDFRSGSVPFNWDEKIELGVAHLAGIGAIGSAFLYTALGHGQLHGTLVGLDDDMVDDKNLGRYILFTKDDVNSKKVDAAASRLRSISSILEFKAEPMKLQNYSKRQPSEFRLEKLISAPDRRDTRRAFQWELPREIWDASTGPSQIVLHHNRFEQDLACLDCIYPAIPEENAHAQHMARKLGVPINRIASGEPINSSDAEIIHKLYPHLNATDLINRDFNSVFRDLCAAAELRVENQVVLAPLAFISAAAGAFLYLELVKSLRKDVFSPFHRYNYAQINPLYSPNPLLLEKRPARVTCKCQSKIYRQVFEQLWH